MPHDRGYPNPGRAPTRWPEDTAISVQWANGNDARHTYTVKQLRWTRTGSGFDIATFWRA